MSAGGSIFFGDTARMLTARPHEAQLIGRPIVDPVALDEANFRLDHGGMSRVEWERKFEEIRREDERDAAVSDTQGEPPDCDTRGLSPQRARFARYSAWRQGESKKLKALEGKRAQFEAMIAAPAVTEGAIRGAVRRAADKLLGRAQGSEPKGDDRRSLDERLADERYAAEAAREALPDLDRQIENARLRVSKLDEREQEFLGPAIAEAAEASGLGALYLKKIRELREVTELVLGLSQVAGGYGSGLGNGIACHIQGELRPQTVMAVDFPSVGFKSVGEDRGQYRIDGLGRPDVWANLRRSLVLDPYHRAHIALPKS